MNTLNIQTLEKYHAEGWLIKQTHPSLPLTIWNYSQATQYQNKWDEITLQCRGLVTHSETGEIIARPFQKFFNIEDNKHKPTPEFEVYEKLDGSLIIGFWYQDNWILASRGSFTSDQVIAASKMFQNVYSTKNFEKDTTYMFELIAPWNRIVVDYGNEEKLVLLGGIRTKDKVEVPYEILEYLGNLNGLEVVKRYRYDGLKDIRVLKSLVPDNAEGFVVKFTNGERVKIKGEKYIQLHKNLTNISSHSIWKTLMKGESLSSILDNVPDEFFDWVKSIEKKIREEFLEMKNFYIQEYKKYQNIDCQKKFAEEINKLRGSGINIRILFELRSGKNIDDSIWKMVKPQYELPFKKNQE